MPQVAPDVHGASAPASKGRIAELALERFFSSMNILVLGQFSVIHEAFAADVTLEFPIENVGVLKVDMVGHLALAHHDPAHFAGDLVVEPFNVSAQGVLVFGVVGAMLTGQVEILVDIEHVPCDVGHGFATFFAHFVAFGLGLVGVHGLHGTGLSFIFVRCVKVLFHILLSVIQSFAHSTLVFPYAIMLQSNMGLVGLIRFHFLVTLSAFVVMERPSRVQMLLEMGQELAQQTALDASA